MIDMREWPSSGRPAIRAPEPPEARHDHLELLDMAQTMLAARQARFPALVDGADMTADEATSQLRLFEDLVADWQFIANGVGEPGSYLTLRDRRAALDESILTIADIARKRGGFDDTLADQAQRVIALRWHLEPGRPTIALARLSRELQAEARQVAAAAQPTNRSPEGE